MGDGDAVPEDAVRPLGIPLEDVRVDLVQEGNDGVDRQRALDRPRVVLVQAELAVLRDVVGVVSLEHKASSRKKKEKRVVSDFFR